MIAHNPLHSTTQNSSDNLQTFIIAQVFSIRSDGNVIPVFTLK